MNILYNSGRTNLKITNIMRYESANFSSVRLDVFLNFNFNLTEVIFYIIA